MGPLPKAQPTSIEHETESSYFNTVTTWWTVCSGGAAGTHVAGPGERTHENEFSAQIYLPLRNKEFRRQGRGEKQGKGEGQADKGLPLDREETGGP